MNITEDNQQGSATLPNGSGGNQAGSLHKGKGYMSGDWIYTDSTGKRHLLKKEKYSSHHQSTYWTSLWNGTDCDFWTEEYCQKYGYNINREYSWALGTFALTRKSLIQKIEKGLSK